MELPIEIELMQQQVLDFLGEFQTLIKSESRLREAVRSEATRAEAAESSSLAAQRAAAEALNGAAAATAGANQAAAELSAAYEQTTSLKIRLEIAERQQANYEKEIIRMTSTIADVESQLQKLRSLQSTQASLERQYTELQERTHVMSEDKNANLAPRPYAIIL